LRGNRHGKTIEWTNGTGSDVSSGDPVVVGNTVCVAAVDIADGSSGILAADGVFELPKTAGSAITQGDAALFDISAGEFLPSSGTAAAGDISGACLCWEAAASADTTVVVKIGGIGTVEAGS